MFSLFKLKTIKAESFDHYYSILYLSNKHICELCGLLFKTKRKIINHIRKKHKDWLKEK